MGKYQKVYAALMDGSHDSNMDFEEVTNLLIKLGAVHRTRGDHFIFSFSGCRDIINLQPKGTKVKPYQAKQIRQFLTSNGIQYKE